MKEKRRHVRVNSLNLLHVSVDENNETLVQGMGRTLNVSESGILLETHFSLEEEKILTLTIAFEDELMDLKGKIIHSRAESDGSFETGIQFIDLNETTRHLLNLFVDSFERRKKEQLNDE